MEVLKHYVLLAFQLVKLNSCVFSGERYWPFSLKHYKKVKTVVFVKMEKREWRVRFGFRTASVLQNQWLVKNQGLFFNQKKGPSPNAWNTGKRSSKWKRTVLGLQHAGYLPGFGPKSGRPKKAVLTTTHPNFAFEALWSWLFLTRLLRVRPPGIPSRPKLLQKTLYKENVLEQLIL